MPTLDCATDRRDGLTLVECVVHNDTTDRRRLRVTNRLDGAIRAPPDGPDWTDGTATCTLAPGERAALGYATRAPPREPPAELTDDVLDRGEGSETASRPLSDEPVRPDGAGIALPPAVAAWFSALEERVAAVEDGHREVSPGPATVVVDRETLATLERRAADLGERLAAARERDGSA
jgi:hypothetical protein